MNFLLIPGAGGDAWVWSRVEPELVALGHTAVSIDLPVEDETAGIEEYSRTALSAIEGLTDPVVVGLSLGSFTAALVCLEAATTSLVFVNGMLPLPGETPGEWWDATGQSRARAANDVREGRDPDAAFDPMTTFFHDVPADIVGEAGEHNRVQSNGPFTSAWALPRWPDVPIHVVIGRDDRFFPEEFQRRLTEQRLGIEPEVIDGGHLLPLSSPVELATLLDSYARTDNP
jgi:pimeloyl-ACP methyl ester carboxylesterase